MTHVHNTCQVGQKIVVQGIVPVQLRELFRRSAGSVNVTVDEINNTTTFSGGMSAFQIQHPTVHFLQTKKSKKKCWDLEGLCVNDDDYVHYTENEEGGDAVPIIPIQAATTAKTNT